MILLAIETSSSSVSVALLSAEKVLGYCWERMERGQGEALIPLIQDLLTDLRLDIQQITAVAAAIGPGSFTGVRVALSAARAIGLALNIPVMGVTNFETAAFGLPKPLVVVLDTKRGDYYTQFFNEAGLPEKEPQVLSGNDLKKHLPFVAVGDGAIKLQDEIGCAVVEQQLAPAVCVGKIALMRLDNPLPAEPFYLRGADVSL